MRLQNKRLTTRHFLILVLGLISIIQAILILVLYLSRDCVPPIISFPAENLVLTQEEFESALNGDYDCLLEDIVVEDETKRDMSGRCIVSDFRMDRTGQYAIATYKAMDYSGNITSERRIVSAQ